MTTLPSEDRTPAENLPAGRELDALVAVKVMGWQMFPYFRFLSAGNCELSYCPPGAEVHISTVREVPPYSTDITAAWRVVERMHESDQWRFALEFSGRKCNVEATFDVWRPEGHRVAKEWGGEQDVAYVICLAALKAVGA